MSVADTSREAYANIGQQRITQQRVILQLLKKSGALSNSHIEKLTSYPISSVTARIYELRGDGKVEKAYTDTGLHGRNVTFWRLCEKKRPEQLNILSLANQDCGA